MGGYRKGSFRESPWAGGKSGPHSYCGAQDSTGAEVLRPGWLVWLPLTQAASHPLPMLSTGTPALSYWLTPHTSPQKNPSGHQTECRSPQNKAVPGRVPICCLWLTACYSAGLFQKPLAHQSPSRPPPGRLPIQFIPSLMLGLPGHRQ